MPDLTDWLRSTTLCRQIERRLGRPSLVVVEHHAWQGYAIQCVRPGAMRIRLRRGESAKRLLAAVPESARAVLAHIDVSRTAGFIASESELWEALRRRGTLVLNAAVTDIRKRTLQARCEALGLPSSRAAQEGAPEERVIIKTNLNSGGAPERELARRVGGSGAPFGEELNHAMRAAVDYRVLRRDEVHTRSWVDPTLVVERFIENPEGVFFRVHAAGPATSVAEVWSELEVKKLMVGVRQRINHLYWKTASGDAPIAGAPSSDRVARVVALARRLFAEMAVAFGAADCVMDSDGTLVVVDVNKTPGGADISQQPEVVAHLRRGFDALLAVGY